MEFKTRFKPLRTIFLVLIILLSIAVVVYLVYIIFNTKQTQLEIIGFITIGLMYAFGIYSSIKMLIKTCVCYTIREDEIECYSFITFKKKIIPKSEIRGFSKSWAMARAKSYDLTIIYLKNRDKIIFHELDFYNYFEIKPNLTKLGYYYLGHEGEEFKGFFTRIYKFDSEK
jgi:hypothetical protein